MIKLELFKKGNLQRIFTVSEHLFSNVHTKAWSRVFFGGLLIWSIYLGILHVLALPSPVLGHHPFLVIIIKACNIASTLIV